MSDKQDVLILNQQGGEVFNGQANLTNIKLDKNSGCLVADCHLEKGLSVSVWEIDGRWQGWIK
jgi:hypothetical protein